MSCYGGMWVIGDICEWKKGKALLFKYSTNDALNSACHIRHRFIGYVPEIIVIATHHQHNMRVVCPVVVCSTGEEEWSPEKKPTTSECVCKRLYVDLMSF